MDAFKDAVTRFGKPEEVLTDQGRQYFAWRGKSDFERSLEKEGIKHIVSRAHHPQTLGKCERFWETVMNEFWTRAKPQDLDEARVRLKYFIDHYNHHRPHQGLEGQVPAERFFGVAQEVRAVIEKTVEQNALNMAIGELPKPPAFLIGQVGEKRIAFHGTSGSFYLTEENLRGESNGEQDRSVGANSSSEAIAPSAQSSSDDGENEVPVDPDPRPLGSVDGGGSSQGEADLASDDGILDGALNESGGSSEARDEAGPVLADVDASAGRDDGGSTHATSL